EWCLGSDSNRHALRHRILSPARLPIPPPRHGVDDYRRNAGNTATIRIIRPMRLDDFHYDLPPELIAQAPAGTRSSSRLLHLDGATGALRDGLFPDIVNLL